ncbi:Disintegrin and metalloproteinase domain-containing protein 30 [Camelus dromedarius]|uniref:Disintegrin and metalloproteinase domain-containing protein 30 n=1 Tax=Camelus dromedarius TaxID=9838 RepID=A0A5N4DVL3_CAMDR|nr:Disintegrin and metalloproteinase domain-containing protein 30 [Camelus dromedarius]
MRSGRPFLSHGRSLPVLLLALLLADCLGKDPVFHPEWGFDSYEVTIPKKLSFRREQQGVAKHVSYLLQVKGKNHVLHLWPKRFLLARNLQVFSFTEQGQLWEDHPYVPSDCNYMGLVEGNQDSEATLSTCTGGLRGILQIDARHYQIEPLRASSRFEHVVYLLKKEQAFPSQICGLSHDDTVKQMAQQENVARISDLTESYMHQKYLELALVFDHSRYLYLNSNLTLVVNDAILLTAIADSYFQDVRAKCLTNIPGIGFVVKRCGNKIVEEDEECDCGSGEDCKTDQCCQPDCKFKQGANCSTGLCCHNCHFRPSGYMCRKEENECDLAEYCSGTSGLCPSDTYKQDGTPCKYEARCVKKGCQARYMQCQSIFGPDAMEAPIQCYDVLNVIGDQYGNCGVSGAHQYETCTGENVLCGRIQCINVNTIPDMPDHTLLISTHLQEENLMCWGIGYHLSMVAMGIPDLGVENLRKRINPKRKKHHELTLE